MSLASRLIEAGVDPEIAEAAQVRYFGDLNEAQRESLDARLAAVATAQVPAEVAHLLPQKVAPPVPAQEETVEEEPQSKGGGFLTNSTEEPVAPEGEVTADGGPSVGSGQSAS